MQCPKCSSEKLIKNGKVNNKQRYQCKVCKKQFLEYKPESVNYLMEKKRQALILLLHGLSYRKVASITGINYLSVYNWSKEFPTFKKLKNKAVPQIIQLRELLNLLNNNWKNSQNACYLLIDLVNNKAYLCSYGAYIINLQTAV